MISQYIQLGLTKIPAFLTKDIWEQHMYNYNELHYLVLTDLTPEEIAQKELEQTPVIPDSEISPADHLFVNHEDQDDVNLYEEK